MILLILILWTSLSQVIQIDEPLLERTEEDRFSVEIYQDLPCMSDYLKETRCLDFLVGMNHTSCLPVTDMLPEVEEENEDLFIVITKNFIDDRNDTYRFMVDIYNNDECRGNISRISSFTMIETGCLAVDSLFPESPGLRIYRFCYEWAIYKSLYLFLFLEGEYTLSIFFVCHLFFFSSVCFVHFWLVYFYMACHRENVMISRVALKIMRGDIIVSRKQQEMLNKGRRRMVFDENAHLESSSAHDNEEDEEDEEEDKSFLVSENQSLKEEQEEEEEEGGGELLSSQEEEEPKEEELRIIDEADNHKKEEEGEDENSEEVEDRMWRIEVVKVITTTIFYCLLLPMFLFCSMVNLILCTPCSDCDVWFFHSSSSSADMGGEKSKREELWRCMERKDMILIRRHLLNQNYSFYLTKIGNCVKSLIMIFFWSIKNSIVLIVSIITISSYNIDVNDAYYQQRKAWNSSVETAMITLIFISVFVLNCCLLLNISYRISSTFQTSVFIDAFSTYFHYRLFQSYVNSLGIIFALYVTFTRSDFEHKTQINTLGEIINVATIVVPITLLALKIARVNVSKGVGSSKLMIIYKQIPIGASLLLPDPHVRLFFKTFGNPRRVVMGAVMALSILTEEKFEYHKLEVVDDSEEEESLDDYSVLIKDLYRDEKYRFIHWNIVKYLDHDSISLLIHLLLENQVVDIYAFLFEYYENKSKRKKKGIKKSKEFLTNKDNWLKKDELNYAFEFPRVWIPAKFFYNQVFHLEYGKSLLCFTCAKRYGFWKPRRRRNELLRKRKRTVDIICDDEEKDDEEKEVENILFLIENNALPFISITSVRDYHKTVYQLLK